VLGVELTAFHTDDDPARRGALAERLVDCLAALLGPHAVTRCCDRRGN